MNRFFCETSDYAPRGLIFIDDFSLEDSGTLLKNGYNTSHNRTYEKLHCKEETVTF